MKTPIRDQRGDRHPENNQFTQPPGRARTVGLFVATLAASLCLARASTFVCGNVSGAWTTTGSPYVATCNLTVPSGQTLTIQPGVTLIMGQGLNMDVEGAISAVGTAAQRIIIRGASPSLYWDKIYINYNGGAQSTFVNCTITDATNALQLNMFQITATMAPQIADCIFSNCVDTCVYGAASPGGFDNNPNLAGYMVNCKFSASSNGIHLYNSGTGYGGASQGTINMTVVNNLFQGLTGTAMWFDIGSNPYPQTSTPKADNNIFLQCGTAVEQTGSSGYYNEEIAYNSFYNCSTNFVGLAAGIYGTICCQNARGTNCDLAYNIFQNPLFAETVSYTLSANSPCIDAGNPGAVYLDVCFPPSQGTTINDIGLYGGNACGWVPPTNTVYNPSITKSVAISFIPPSNGNYQLQYANAVRNGTNTWFTLTNLYLNAPFTYYDPVAWGQRYYRALLMP
jgi:hypothetical protein